jgi:hypothetical protein
LRMTLCVQTHTGLSLMVHRVSKATPKEFS